MALTIAQKKAKKPKQAQLEAPPKDLLAPEKPTQVEKLTHEEKEAVDLLAQMEASLAEVKPLLKKYEETKAFVASIAADGERFDPEKPAVLKGFKAEATFSEVCRSREVKDMAALIAKLREVLGYENLIAEIKIPLSVADKYLTPAEQESVIGKSDKGSRRFKGVHDL